MAFGCAWVTLNVTAHPIDSTRHQFIKQYPDHLFIWPLIRQRTLSFSVEKRNADGEAVQFEPNSTVSMGIGLYVFEVGAELSLSVPLDEKSQSRFGSSDVRDLQGHLVGINWSLDGFAQRYSSFYLANPLVVIQNNQPYPIRPDFELRNFGASGIYAFNRTRFSLRSAYNFAERQLKSGGSVMLAGTLNSVQLGSDSVVLSTASQSRLRVNNTFSHLRYTTLSAAPGYSYNLIYRNWFINFTLSVGPAHHWVYYEDKDGRPHYDIAINSFVDSRFALGYNSDRWFGGLSFVNQAREVRFDQFQFTTTTSSFKMMIGYRILEKGIFKKRAWDFVPKLLSR